jgi:hypothetical protein
MTEVHVAEFVRSAPTRYPSFVRSFAYASGPSYGFLLDRVYPRWREQLTPENDLGELGPGLILPLTARVQCAFDPRATVPIPELGTVFPSIHVSDAWGILHVERGGLWISNDWRTSRIVAADDLSSHRLSGDGWTLQLAEGWGIQAAERPGDVELVQ